MAYKTEEDASIQAPCFCKTVSEYCLEGAGPSCWMQVPPEFVRSFLQHVNLMHTVLQNAGGATWPVQYVGGHGFVAGWAEFATGNALAVGDTLVFSFVEEGKKFAVQVFGKSGCEKETRKQRELSPPAPAFTPHIHDQADIRSAPCRFQAGVKAVGKRWRQKQARVLVMKARLRKINSTPPQQQQQQERMKKPKIGLDAASEYHGRSSPDSLRWGDTEAAADLRAFMSHTRFHVEVPPKRKPGRPCKDSTAAVVTEKRKRGRPLKHQAVSDLTSVPARDIFVSRRRKVTQLERDLAHTAAHQLASRLHASTTCVLVMRQSYVYRNFVLCVPRLFANRYMPDTNREVALVDGNWKAWFGAWNAEHKYISGGWRNFALEHCLEEDDALVMEILEDHPRALTLKVHLFPVVPVPEGLTGWHAHVCPPNVGSVSTTTGVPIDPSVLRVVGTIQPRSPRPRKRIGARKLVYKSSSGSEDELITASSSSDSSDELFD